MTNNSLGRKLQTLETAIGVSLGYYLEAIAEDIRKVKNDGGNRHYVEPKKDYPPIAPATSPILPLRDMPPPRMGFGLGGGGRKLTAHAGVLKFAEEAFSIHEIDYPIELALISAGAIDGTLYLTLKQDYLAHPNRLKPSQRLEQIILENQHIFRLSASSFNRMEGIVHRKIIEEFLKKMLDYRTFNDIPNLYIIAHNSTTGENIVFGEVKKDYPVWKATMASIAWQPWIKGVEDPEGYLIDGGTLRATPLNELYSHTYLTHRVIVFLGMHRDGPQQNGKDSAKGGPIQRLAQKVHAYEERGAEQHSSRETYDFKRDLRDHDCMPLGDVLEGRQRNLTVIAPWHRHVPFLARGLPLELIDIGYAEAKAAFERYFRHHPEEEANFRRLGISSSFQ